MYCIQFLFGCKIKTVSVLTQNSHIYLYLKVLRDVNREINFESKVRKSSEDTELDPKNGCGAAFHDSGYGTRDVNIEKSFESKEVMSSEASELNPKNYCGASSRGNGYSNVTVNIDVILFLFHAFLK